MREVFDFGLTRFYKMVKAKKTELRSGTIGMSAHRYTDLKFLRTSSDLYWNVQNIQPFFPPIEKLFKVSENSSEYGIRFPEEITNILSATTVRTSASDSVNVHTKITMLLSPFKWMQGDYGSIGLPTTMEQSKITNNKLQSSNNAAYVGAIISAALSHSSCLHFPKIFGLFSGISKKHIIDISDDYEELSDRSWFSTNIGKTFEISMSDSVTQTFQHTRTTRPSIQIGDEAELGDIVDLEGINDNSAVIGDVKSVFQDMIEDSESCSNDSDVSTAYIFGVESCDCSEGSELSEEEEDSECFAKAIFNNVPVQITVMEKCLGTFYELCVIENEPEKHLAFLSQVIFALAYAQRHFAFTHNDLHANNVMYIKTDKEFLYYTSEGSLYKVPTYGYLIKIIDFERSIASIKLNGMKESKLFVSDHFSIDEEAGGQYNMEPFYTPKHNVIKPNSSFDLVRLATSMFWDLFPEGPDHAEYVNNQVFKFFMKWLTLEDGSSILFGKKNKKHDRFHGFHLYKAITRLCKENAIPRKEIVSLKPIYGTNSIPLDSIVCSIDF